MAEMIEYFIQDKNSYGKDITNIMEKNPSKRWMSEFPLKLVQINLKLKEPSFVQRVQARGHNTEVLEVIFMDMDKEKIGIFKKVYEYNKEITISNNVQFSQRVAYITLRLTTADDKDKILGLNFILFKGASNPLKINKQKPTNLTSQQTLQKTKLQTFTNNGGIRVKANPSRPYANLIKPTDINFHQRQKTIVQTNKKVQVIPDEEDQMNKAIKQSQKTFELESKIKKLLHDDLNSDNEDSDTIPLPPERKYKVASLSQIMNCLQFVNARWLEAQRNAKKEMVVKEEERLSHYVVIKLLINKQIVIDKDSIMGPRRKNLQQLANTMGAKLTNQIRNYCIIISTSWQKSLVQKAINNYKGVRAVNQNYLIDCKKLNRQLDWRDYSLKK